MKNNPTSQNQAIQTDKTKKHTRTTEGRAWEMSAQEALRVDYLTRGKHSRE